MSRVFIAGINGRLECVRRKFKNCTLAHNNHPMVQVGHRERVGLCVSGAWSLACMQQKMNTAAGLPCPPFDEDYLTTAVHLYGADPSGITTESTLQDIKTCIVDFDAAEHTMTDLFVATWAGTFIGDAPYGDSKCQCLRTPN